VMRTASWLQELARLRESVTTSRVSVNNTDIGQKQMYDIHDNRYEYHVIRGNPISIFFNSVFSDKETLNKFVARQKSNQL
jgi:hypothetical protein